MPRLLRLTHVYGKTKTTIMLDEVLPYVDDDGRVNEGYYFLVLERDRERIAVKLNEIEAALLVIRLWASLRAHSDMLSDLQVQRELEAMAKAKQDKQNKRGR